MLVLLQPFGDCILESSSFFVTLCGEDVTEELMGFVDSSSCSLFKLCTKNEKNNEMTTEHTNANIPCILGNAGDGVVV